MNSGKILLGVLAGVAAGAFVGILFAPDKGSRTRKRILNKGEDYANALKEKFDLMVDSITEKYENAQEEAEELILQGKAKVNEVKKETINGTL